MGPASNASATTAQRLNDRGLALKGTRTRIRVEFNQDHPEALLVPEQVEGGQRSCDLMEQLALAPSSLPDVTTTLARSPKTYGGIHVKNADDRSDDISLLKDMAIQLRGKRVRVCRDDAAVIHDARQHFRASGDQRAARQSRPAPPSHQHLAGHLRKPPIGP